MNKCKTKKVEEQMLNKEFQEAYLIFENNPSQENQTTLNVLRERTKKLYEEKVYGIITRSGARWHEHGEKNSKYFFLTWKNKIIPKKHIRKLRMIRMITTDPFEILYQILAAPLVKRIEKPFVIFYLNALFSSVFGVWCPLV